MNKMLDMVYSDDTLVYRTGKAVLEKNGLVLMGVSPGNTYFKPEVIEDYIRYLARVKRRTVVYIPGVGMGEHTLKASGSKQPKRRTKEKARQVTMYFNQAIEKLSKDNALVGEVYLLNWEKDVFSNSAYIASLDFFMKLYKENPEFRYDTSRGTAMVIGRDYVSQSDESFSETLLAKFDSDEGIQEGVLYTIKELAFFISSKDIFKVESVVNVYHKQWRVYERYVNGDYDGVPKEGFGKATIGYKGQE